MCWTMGDRTYLLTESDSSADPEEETQELPDAQNWLPALIFQSDLSDKKLPVRSSNHTPRNVMQL